MKLISGAIAFLGFLCLSGSAVAQTLSLVAETIIDPGRFSDPPTAQVNAVGAMSTFGTASAADAAVNPAGLLRGPRYDVAAAIGMGQVSRDIFMRTSTAAGIERELIAGRWFPSWFAAAAVRRRAWAAGGFYDVSSRRRHRVTTGDRPISLISSPGGVVFQAVSGRTDLSEAVDVSRVGGSMAVAPFGEWLSVGGGVELMKVQIDTASNSDLQVRTQIRPQPLVTSRARETIAFVADQWNTGFTLAAEVRVELLTVSILRRRAPAFTAALSGENRNLDTGSVRAFGQQLTIDAPDLFSVGAAVTIAATKIGFEIARLDYGLFDRAALSAVTGDFLQPPGATWEPRAGVRHAIAIGGPHRLVFSTGIRREGIHAMSSSLTSPFVPEPRTRTWITGGGAFESSGVTIAVGVGGARAERRILATVGLRSRR